MTINSNNKNITPYLPLIVTIVSIGIAWGVQQTKIGNVEARVETIETTQKNQDDRYNSLNLDVKTRLTNIETILNERLPKRTYGN